MKATLTFELPEEIYDHRCAIHGTDFKGILDAVLLKIRNTLKYEDTTEEVCRALEDIRELIVSELNDRTSAMDL
jgi:hypothetical protein